jgi:CheY-like chemotaxis protein
VSAMDGKFSIFVVDDDPVIQTLLASVLSKDESCAVEVFPSSEACLSRLDTQTPDMFLLDVFLPRLDGFALCRKLRERDVTRGVPVTFISSYDSEEDRLSGYEAGGDDFVVKPFSTDELLLKVAVARRLVEERANLKKKASETEMKVFQILSNTGESPALLQIMGELVDCHRIEDVADAVLRYLGNLKLSGVVQSRGADHSYTVSPEGHNRPLEVSVISHVKEMGRVFEFRKRAIVNYPSISVMVNDMPLNDATLCEQIRERLSIVVGMAASRIESIEAVAACQRRQHEAGEALNSIQRLMQELEGLHKKAHDDAANIICLLQENFVRAFVKLGLTAEQEDSIDRLVKESMASLAASYEEPGAVQRMLEQLSETLRKLASA